MLRKAAPALLFVACGLSITAAAWAQDNSQRPTPLGQFRDFLLGDDQEPAPHKPRVESRAGDRQAGADGEDADNSSNSQRSNSNGQTSGPVSRSDFGGDRKTRPGLPAYTNNPYAVRKNSEAPASPYQYSGKYSDKAGDNDNADNQPSSRRTAQGQAPQGMGSRMEQQFSGARERDSMNSGNNENSSPNRNMARLNNSRSGDSSNGANEMSRPAQINNPHVAARAEASPSVMRGNDNIEPTPARSARSVQDRLSAAQIAAEESPPVRVPSTTDSAKQMPSSRRTTAAGMASSNVPTATTNAAGNANSVPAPFASSGPRMPTQLTPSAAPHATPEEAASTAPRVAARPEVFPAPAPVAAAAPSSRRTAGGPLAGVADSRPAKRPELPADNVLFTRQSPLISVETAGPKTISIGKEATYVITLQNAAEVAAQDVVVGIKVPEWADVVGAHTTAGTTQPASQPGEPYQWKLSKFDGHGKEQLSLRLVPRQSRPFDLGVQYTFSPISSQTVVEVQEPKLQLDLVGPKEVAYGQTKVFRLTLSNPGTGDAENIIIKLLPLGDRKDTGASHQLGTLAAGESKVIEVELTARETGALSIRAEAVADGGLRAEVSDSVLVRRAGLQIDVDSPKVKYAGTPATFIVHVSNPGNANAENTQLTATLPTGAKFISASGGGQLASDQANVTWSLGTLGAGSDTSYEVKCLLNTPGPNRLQVVSTASDELSATGGSSTQVEALADLKLDILDPPGPVAVGEEAVYEVHVKNRGTKAAEQIEVVSFFSGGLEPTAAQGGQFEIARGQITFAPVASLAPGSEIVLKVKAAADKPGSHVFRTEVLCRSLESKLASEVTTRFYGDDSAVPTEAKQPTPAVRRTEALVPLPKSEEPRPFPTTGR